MGNLLLHNLLTEVLGESKRKARNNYAFKCPKGCVPHKYKLEINLDTNQYQCWVCGGEKGGVRGKNLKYLFKTAKATPTQYSRLNKLVQSTNIVPSEKYEDSILELPKEFKTFENNTDIIAKHALAYLKKRNITEGDILKHNIGYCEYGSYANRIIIPSYDFEGKLNYFISRTFKDDYQTYKNPDVSRNIIPFELFINWDLPIILCEGPFDALAIKRNAIPLLGKNIQSNLKKKIISSKVKKIYIALDKDALKKALEFCEMLLNEGKKVYLVEMEDKDPSEMGFELFTKLIQKSTPLDTFSLMEKRIYI